MKINFVPTNAPTVRVRMRVSKLNLSVLFSIGCPPGIPRQLFMCNIGSYYFAYPQIYPHPTSAAPSSANANLKRRVSRESVYRPSIVSDYSHTPTRFLRLLLWIHLSYNSPTIATCPTKTVGIRCQVVSEPARLAVPVLRCGPQRLHSPPPTRSLNW